MAVAVIMLAFSCKDDKVDPSLEVNTKSVIFDSKAGDFKIGIKSNVRWIVTNQHDWITVSKLTGDGNDTWEEITVSAPENTGAYRSGSLTVRAGDKSEEVNVVQYSKVLSFGTPEVVGVLKTNFSISGAFLKIPYSGAIGNETFDITVTATGEASEGISIAEQPVTLSAPAGDIQVPISGKPEHTGKVKFVSTTTITDPKTGELLTIPDVEATVELGVLGFANKNEAEDYFEDVYGYIPHYWKTLDEPWSIISDEASIAKNVTSDVVKIMNGTWSASDIPCDKWNHYWTGIQKTIYFQQAVRLCPGMTEPEIATYTNDARFLRAYYYFQLMKLYGPVPILEYDEEEFLDVGNENLFVEYSRSSWDDCVEYVCAELDAVAAELPQTSSGKPTKGTALAVKSQLLLYSASPLFNGGLAWAGKLPATPDPTKWQKAAVAAKAVIDLDYHLVVKYDEGDINPYKSLYAIFRDKWNSETIFGYELDAENTRTWYQTILNRQVHTSGRSLVGPSQKMIDAYAMRNNGIYPITGYSDASATNDGGELPIIDTNLEPPSKNCAPYLGNNASNLCYEVPGQADSYYEVLINDAWNTDIIGYINGFIHPFDGTRKTDGMARMTCDREPRFYLDIAYNSMQFHRGVEGDGYAQRNETNFTPTGNFVLLNLLYGPGGGTGGKADGSELTYSATGFLQRKTLDRAIIPADGNWGQPMVWQMIRLAEIYLNYVEALIESDPSNADIFIYWNKIRERAGLPEIQSVYPDVVGNQARMREMLRRERQIELAFENHRYFDTRRWMIAEKTNNGNMYGQNIGTDQGAPQGKPQNDSGVASFYKRTVCENGERVFQQKHYFWPVNTTFLGKNPNIGQAPGW